MRTKLPPHYWLVIDLESVPGDDVVFGWFSTRREAKESCDRLNRMPGYEPTCQVVKYVRPVPKRSTER